MSTISNTNQTTATNDYSSLLWRIELLEKEVKKLRNSSSKRSLGNKISTKKNEHFRITILKAEAAASKKAVTAEKKAAKQADKKQKSEAVALKKAATAETKESISIIQSLFV